MTKTPWTITIPEEGDVCIVWAATEREAVIEGERITACPCSARPTDAHGVAREVVNGELPDALRDVIAEREKQRAKWGDDHDDAHADSGLAAVAAFLIVTRGDVPAKDRTRVAEIGVGWAADLADRHPERRDRLVIAAALLVAEIERIDRGAR